MFDTSVYLVDVVELEVFEEQQQQSTDGLHDDLLVSIHVHPKFHRPQYWRSETNTGTKPSDSEAWYVMALPHDKRQS